jgi:hypothetical protein
MALMLGCALVFTLSAHAADPIATPIKWTVDRARPAKIALYIKRGESIDIMPRFFDGGLPVNLFGAVTVDLFYRPSAETNLYRLPGSVTALQGELCFHWTPAAELTNSAYVYEVVISGLTNTSIRQEGTITMQPNLGYTAPTNNPQPIYTIDFATVQLFNTGLAPFLNAYVIGDLQELVAGWQNGTGSIDVNNLTVRGTLVYTNWPAYLARTNDLPANVITGLTVTGYATMSRTGPNVAITVTGDGGGSGGGGIGSYTNTRIAGVDHTNSVAIGDGSNLTWRLRDGSWRPDLSIQIPDAEMASVWDADALGTNRLAYKIGGQIVGYYDSNGLTLLTGSLTLWEEDLTCNVRLNDGSRTDPSLTLEGHPGTMGMYGRGYMGSWGFGFSHAGSDVLMINSGGLYTLNTNAVLSGRHIGDISEATGYPEPLFYAWATNALYPALTITNAGALTIKSPPANNTGIELNGSNRTVSLRDVSQYDRVKLDGGSGTVTLKDAGGTTRFSVSAANTYFTGIRTQYTRNVSNTAMITNIFTVESGLIKTWQQ